MFLILEILVAIGTDAFVLDDEEDSSRMSADTAKIAQVMPKHFYSL
jgi:hypothetical protein